MADEKEHQPYPKWLASHGFAVDTEEQEKAVLNGTAIIEEVQAASGTIRRFAGFKPKPKPLTPPTPKAKAVTKPKPQPKTRSKKKKAGK